MDDLPTAATDGKNLYYNPEFVANLSKDEQTFLFAHEICHVAFDHIFRSEGKNPYLWNIATDSVINALLKQDKLKMIEGGVDIPEAVNYNAEQMYEKLLKQQEEEEDKDLDSAEQTEETTSSSGGNSNESKQGEDESKEEESKEEKNSKLEENGKSKDDKQEASKENNPGHDDHSLWKKAVENRKRENEKNNKVKKLPIIQKGRKKQRKKILTNKKWE